MSLAGTTPTIIRAYTGKGTHHHNILREDERYVDQIRSRMERAAWVDKLL